MTILDTALRALNEAAYAAAMAAREADHPSAAKLLRLAHETDELVDALPPKATEGVQG